MMQDEHLVQLILDLQKQVEELETHDQPRFDWRDFTPTLTQNVSVTVTIDVARYAAVGNTVFMQVRMTITGAGTVGTALLIGGVPTDALIKNFNSGGVSVPAGSALYFDSGTGYYQGILVGVTASSFRILTHNATGFLGSSPSFGAANGDLLSFHAAYERA